MTATLSADASSVAEGGTVTYTVTLTGPQGADLTGTTASSSAWPTAAPSPSPPVQPAAAPP
ncbi:hypothetical protein DK37_13995 [Halomonas sp. SUBG004]|nr:hypothetical protein DK37_13995 [Halomonas sp. SUBG004]